MYSLKLVFFAVLLIAGSYSLTALEILDPAKPIPEISVVAPNLRKQAVEVTMAPDGKPAVKLSWSNSDSNKLEFFFDPGIDIPEFKKAKIQIEVYLLKESFSTNFYIRLIDSKVEIFQFKKFLKFDELKTGWQTFHYEINTTEFENDPNVRTWGRNANGKIDYPAKFFGFCIDFTNIKGAGTIYIGKIEIKVLEK